VSADQHQQKSATLVVVTGPPGRLIEIDTSEW
jgi:hypothetical protein